jgi:hypothetical protein
MAAELEAEFVLNSELPELREGEVVNATLRIWPIENLEKKEIEKLSGQVILDSFFVVGFDSINPSENNADVVEAKGTFVAIKKTLPENLFVSYLGQNIRVKFKEVLFAPNSIKENNFQILSQATEFDKVTYLIIFLALALLFSLYYFSDFLKKKFSKKVTTDPRVKFKHLFSNAKNRSDFEEIYHQKETWLPLLELVTPAHKEFFNVLNQYQYKKEWDNKEKNEVLESFEAIRRSFE